MLRSADVATEIMFFWTVVFASGKRKSKRLLQNRGSRGTLLAAAGMTRKAIARLCNRATHAAATSGPCAR
jgi:hypothetical protein